MAITLNEITLDLWWERALALAAVALVVTVAVYGVVALIVKLDDIGLHLSEKDSPAVQKFGLFLVDSVPKLLTILSVVGTVAMLWVGGGIIVHGTHEVGFDLLYNIAHGAEYAVRGLTGALAGVAGWATYAAISAVIGLALGAVIAFVLHKVLGVGAHEAH